jgi:hypothetical protein
MSERLNAVPNGDDSSGDDFGDLTSVEAILADMTAADTKLETPPADLWQAIEADLAEPVAPVVSLAERRSSTTLATTLVAMAAALVLLAGGAWLLSNVGDDDEANDTVVALASLEWDEDAFDPLGADASAGASLRSDGDQFTVSLADAVLPATADEDADLELWLIAPDANGEVADLVSLGVVDPADLDSFEVPAAYDTDEFSVVDISVEPRDGNPEHSGRSILRGALETA